MATLPTFPTDSLYKFAALFGLVLVGFSLWYPEDQFLKADAKVQETLKSLELTHIKVARKVTQGKRFSEELQKRDAALADKRKLIDEAEGALRAKQSAVQEELNRILKNDKGDVKGAASRAEAVTAETNLMNAKMQAQIDEVRRLTDDYRVSLARAEEVSDELAAESVEEKSVTKKLKDLNERASGWQVATAAGLLWGFIMIFAGFTLWYRRIQVYQDRILRRQAETPGDSASA